VWAPLGLKLTPPGGGHARAWSGQLPGADLPQRVADRPLHQQPGAQNTFYLPQGLLRTDGDNTLAIAEWSLAPGAGGLGQMSLVPYEIERGEIPVRDVVSPG
jgi:hypothetical protein